MKLKIKKWCFVCGLSVDLRNKGAFKLADNQLVKNPEYQFICSEACYTKYKVD